jgi:hypothetical protein
MFLRICESFKSANYQKRLGLQIENPQNATFEGPQICGFTICGTYFRTALLANLKHKEDVLFMQV